MKITAITASACVGLLSVLAAQFPNDPYFFVVSSSLIAVIFRLLLVGLLVHLVFKDKFHTVYGHTATRILGITLMLFGAAGIVIFPLSYALFNYIKPADYMFMIGVGSSFAFMSLTYGRGSRRLSLPRVSRPRNIQLRLFSPRGV